ncbi:MAG TPA: sortase [Candidatus Absconditabacterales bacterium]|nr:sortase [Candidatus Absconditabacterales bacterium]
MSIYQRLIVTILLGFFGLSSICPSFAYDTTNKNQGKVITSPKVDTSIPSWFKPMNSNNLNDWLAILPPELHHYKDANQFMVIPAMGMITPIVEIPSSSSDYLNATKGKNFDYNKYLVDGPTIFPGTAPVGTPGNTFIFAHSNYRHDKPGNFKTIFRLTYNIEKGDTILYFKKQGSQRTMYTYEVIQSMLINETDVWIMLPEKGKTQLTLSACWPIGTAKQRWMNKANLIKTTTLQYEINGINNSSSTTSTKGEESGKFIEYNPQQRFESIIQLAIQIALDAIKHITVTN